MPRNKNRRRTQQDVLRRPAISYFWRRKVQAFYFCERTETAGLEIRKVVPLQNAVNASRGKSKLYNIHDPVKKVKSGSNQEKLKRSPSELRNSGILVKVTCTRFNSFLHTVSQPLEKHLARKPHPNHWEFFLCFVVKCFNSTGGKDCFLR